MSEAAVHAIYEAAAQPERWPAALQILAESLNAVGALLLHRRDDGRVGTIVSPRLETAAHDYAANWAHRDLRAERGLRYLASGRRNVVHDVEIVTEEEIASEPIFQEFLKPHGLLWTAGASVSPTPDVVVMLSVIRALDSDPFSPEDLRNLDALSKHAERALALSIRLLDAEVAKLGFAEALDQLDCGAIVLGPGLRVLYQNTTAQALMGCGLVVTDGRLRATAPDDNQRLRSAVADLANSFNREPPVCLVLNRRADTAVIVRVLPLSYRGSIQALSSAETLVLVGLLKPGDPVDPAVVRDVFNLTMGEARLASLVGAGLRPREAADALGIQESTARHVLKRVFDKTSVSRQSELTALMAKLALARR